MARPPTLVARLGVLLSRGVAPEAARIEVRTLHAPVVIDTGGPTDCRLAQLCRDDTETGRSHDLQPGLSNPN